MMYQHFLFDFDNTLFDTEKRKTAFYAMAEIHGYTREEAKAIYKKARLAGDRIAISLASFLHALKEHIIADGKVFLADEVSHIIVGMDKGQCLVPFAKELLVRVSDEKVDRHLITLGVRGWQEEKMRIAGMQKYFAEDQIHIVDGIFSDKLAVVRDIYGADFTGAGALWIDDKPTEVAEVLRAFPDIHAFVRFEPRDGRFTTADCDALSLEFGDRVLSDNTLQTLTVLLMES